MNKDQIYEKLLREANGDANIVGFILAGGRGKGVFTERSDYDVVMVVKDGMKEEYVQKYENIYNSTEVIELGVWDETGFRSYANWGQDDAGYGYNFTHLKALIDRTGEIQELIDQKGKIPDNEVKKFVGGELDKFINYYYRVIKNSRDGNKLAAHLDAAESVPALITIFFGLEGRLRPYNKHIAWELSAYPLKFLPWSPDEFIGKIQALLEAGDVSVMKEVYKNVIAIFEREGYGEIVHGWDGYKME